MLSAMEATPHGRKMSNSFLYMLKGADQQSFTYQSEYCIQKYQEQ